MFDQQILQTVVSWEINCNYYTTRTKNQSGSLAKKNKAVANRRCSIAGHQKRKRLIFSDVILPINYCFIFNVRINVWNDLALDFSGSCKQNYVYECPWCQPHLDSHHCLVSFYQRQHEQAASRLLNIFLFGNFVFDWQHSVGRCRHFWISFWIIWLYYEYNAVYSYSTKLSIAMIDSEI